MKNEIKVILKAAGIVMAKWIAGSLAVLLMLWVCVEIGKAIDDRQAKKFQTQMEIALELARVKEKYDALADAQQKLEDCETGLSTMENALDECWKGCEVDAESDKRRVGNFLSMDR